jgi:uncharacterized membrane protein
MPVCHQMPERSLTLAGSVMAVCARCAGLYMGGILGLLAAAAAGAWTKRTPVWVLAAAVLPTALDAMASFAGLPSLSNVPRLALGVATGTACGWFLAVGVGDLGRIARARSIRDQVRSAPCGSENDYHGV